MACDMYLPISGHGLISDLHTSLIGSDWTIDWYCCHGRDAVNIHRWPSGVAVCDDSACGARVVM